MKKRLFQFMFCFVLSTTAFAQQWAGGTDIYNTNSGNVGIGTTSPSAKLDMNFYNSNTSTPQYGLLLQTGSFHNTTVANSSYFLKTLDQGNGVTHFIVKGNGAVGIGTVNTGSFRLAVEGKVGAREVQITLDNPWPDYVFGSTYKLRDLFSLEKYIQLHKHLPGIPSAAEVEKEGGIKLGEMNTKLLEKIEELTLYVIELKKEIEQLKKEPQ